MSLSVRVGRALPARRAIDRYRATPPRRAATAWCRGRRDCRSGHRSRCCQAPADRRENSPARCRCSSRGRGRSTDRSRPVPPARPPAARRRGGSAGRPRRPDRFPKSQRAHQGRRAQRPDRRRAAPCQVAWPARRPTRLALRVPPPPPRALPCRACRATAAHRSSDRRRRTRAGCLRARGGR